MIPAELLELLRRRAAVLAWVGVAFLLVCGFAQWLGVADPDPFMVTVR